MNDNPLFNLINESKGTPPSHHDYILWQMNIKLSKAVIALYQAINEINPKNDAIKTNLEECMNNISALLEEAEKF